jgi:hypothetical protein
MFESVQDAWARLTDPYVRELDRREKGLARLDTWHQERVGDWISRADLSKVDAFIERSVRDSTGGKSTRLQLAPESQPRSI